MRPLLFAALLALPLVARAQVRIDVQVDSVHRSDQEDRRRARRIPVTPEHLATAFRSELAREILTGARRARVTHDSALRSYDATTYQRLSAGLAFRAVGRERVLFRHENATRVRWEAGTGALVEVKGARTALPMVNSDELRSEIDNELNGDLGGSISAVPYVPGHETLWIGSGMAETQVNDRELVHPLAEGSEAYYRYAVGDSMAYRMPDGKTIRLTEVRIQPREPRWNLIVGSFWFDAASYQLVRAAYRLSVPMDVWEHVKEEEPDADEDIPVWVKPMIMPMRANISTITVEYGLFEGRFWLPRLQAAEGEGQMSFMRAPIRMEQRFEYTSVNGTDPLPLVPLTPDVLRRDSIRTLADRGREGDSTAAELARSMRSADSIVRRARRDSLRNLDSLAREGDETAREQARAMRRRPTPQCDTGTVRTAAERRYEGTVRVIVQVPCDAELLKNSPDLPASIYEPSAETFGQADLDELRAMLDFKLQPEWAPQTPTIRYGLGDGLLRYNRVEGLAPAIASTVALGSGYSINGEFRLGFADLEPNGELGISRSDGRRTLRVGAYRRLAVSNDWGSPLSFGASLSALLFARDEGFYYRTLGAEFSAAGSDNPHFSWRAFAERHDAADVETHASMAKLLNDVRFPANITAVEGEIVGASARIVHSLGEDPNGFRLFTELRGESAVGDFTYSRGLVDLTLSRLLFSDINGALTLSAGGATSSTPLQRWFYLGGSQTIRGQHAGAMSGPTFWMSRLEFGSGAAGFRPTIFGDIGWAGPASAWKHPGRPATGAGIGASIMDGLIRFDVARGIFPRKGVRADLYLEARF